jgi:sporulation protein YlmC with PRC-barrel domain
MMNRHLLTCVAASALFAAPAFAQTNPAPTPAPAPSTNQPAMSQPGASGGAGTFIATRPTDQFRASDLTGERVYGANNENIGEVNDVLLDRTGKVTAVIVGVGGFLGIGEKDVALPMTALQFRPDPENTNAPRTTTGTATPPAGADANTTGSTAAGQPAGGTAGAAQDSDGIPGRLMLSMSKEQLQQAPAFRDDPNEGNNANRANTPAPATAPKP